MHEYVRSQLRVKTNLDTTECTNCKLTLDKDGVQVTKTSFTFPEVGTFACELTGDETKLLGSGQARLQIRGFENGVEFASKIATVNLGEVLLKEVFNVE